MNRPSWILISCLLSFSGCWNYGWIYTSVTEPIVENMHQTKRGKDMVELDSHFLQEPVTSLRIAAEWRSRAIGDAAKVNGLDEIYYADLKKMSILGGLYKRETVQVWGNRLEPHAE